MEAITINRNDLWKIQMRETIGYTFGLAAWILLEIMIVKSGFHDYKVVLNFNLFNEWGFEMILIPSVSIMLLYFLIKSGKNVKGVIKDEK